jgi:hypothetical protein
MSLSTVTLPLLAELGLVLAAGMGALLCLAALAGHLPGDRHVFPFDPAPPATVERRPAQLVRLAHIVQWSSASAQDAHTRLRPELIAIAEVRLARRGLHLPGDHAEAARLLGPAAWALLRPDRPEAQHRDAPAMRESELAEILAALEAL